MITSEGFTVFDNNVANMQTSGRDIDARGNKTITLDDILVMYAKITNNGFIPNCLIMHPMAWVIFARDPILRAFGFANGGPIFQSLQGQPGLAKGWYAGGINTGPVASAPNTATTFTDVPNLFPAPLRIIVSPFVPFDVNTQTTSIVMADSNELGILVVDEDVSTDEFEDPRRDIRLVKLRERYGIGALNEGQAIGLAKNVSVSRAFAYEDLVKWQTGTGALPVINQTGV